MQPPQVIKLLILIARVGGVTPAGVAWPLETCGKMFPRCHQSFVVLAVDSLPFVPMLIAITFAKIRALSKVGQGPTSWCSRHCASMVWLLEEEMQQWRMAYDLRCLASSSCPAEIYQTYCGRRGEVTENINRSFRSHWGDSPCICPPSAPF